MIEVSVPWLDEDREPYRCTCAGLLLPTGKTRTLDGETWPEGRCSACSRRWVVVEESGGSVLVEDSCCG